MIPSSTTPQTDNIGPLLQKIRERLESIVDEGKFEVPVMPRVANQVLALADKNTTSLSDLEKIIRTDQVITAKVLKLANSSFYRGVSEITNVRDAMSRIGLKSLKETLLSLSLQNKLFQMPGFELTLGKLWHHALACASIAQQLAKRLGMDADTAFVAGLLHDIGKVVLIHIASQLEEEERKKLKEKKQKSGVPFDAARFQVPMLREVLLPLVLDEYHCRLGQVIAQKWNLPAEVAQVIQFHHELDKAPDARLVKIVHLANLYCHHLGLGHDPSPLEFSELPVVRELGISNELLKVLDDEIPKGVQSVLAMV